MAVYTTSPGHGQVNIDLAPISSCACCGYSLAGLAAQGRCPECGVEYFPEDCGLVFETGWPRIKSPTFLVHTAVGLLAIFLVVPGFVLPFAASTAFLLLSFITFHRWSAYGRVAIRSEGIISYNDNRPAFTIPWEEVRKLQLGGGERRGWGLVIHSTKSRWLRVFPLGRDEESARRFVEHAEAYHKAATE